MSVTTIRFEPNCYPYERLQDFLRWEQDLARGAKRPAVDAEAIRRLFGALTSYEEALQALSASLRRNVFANDFAIIRGLRESLSRPILQGFGAIDAYYHGENFASTGGVRRALTSHEILDAGIQRMLASIFDTYTRISHLLFWRQTLAMPEIFGKSLPGAGFLVRNLDLATELRGQFSKITSREDLLHLSGMGVAMPYAIRDYLEHAFLELLKNSLVAAQKSRKSMEVSVNISRHGNDGIVLITDSGGGVPAEEFHRVFYVGHSLSGDGNGLGWAIISRTINRHGGTLQVDNLPSQGFRTTISLPLSIAPD